MLKDQWALITGATSGIGRATAERFSKLGLKLVLTGRRQERLEELQKRLSTESKIFVFDIRDQENWNRVWTANRPLFSKIRILVNNAGLAAGTDSVQTSKWSDWQNMLDTNITGLMRVTHDLLPAMVAEKDGHIVNLGSVAGRWTYPGGAVYCATKAAVRAFSEGLRMDLMGTGLRVTNIVPGMVETEFSDVRFGDAEKARQVYQGMKPLSAEDIAETIAWSISQPAHVNIQELVVFPTAQAGIGYVHRQ